MMSGIARKAKKPPTLAQRVSRVEVALKNAAPQLARALSLLQTQTERAEQIERRISDQITAVQKQIKERATMESLSGLSRRMAAVEEKFRVVATEERLSEAESQLKDAFSRAETRVTGLEKEIAGWIRALQNDIKEVNERLSAGPGLALNEQVKSLEETVKGLKSQLNRAVSRLETEAGRVDEVERSISNQITQLRNEAREIADNVAARLEPENVITLEEGSVVNLEELEKKWEEQCSLLAVRESELRGLGTRISEELDRVRAEIREQDLFQAAREMEFKNLRQMLGDKMEELERLLGSQAAGKKKPMRLVSFLADIAKKH